MVVFSHPPDEPQDKMVKFCITLARYSEFSIEKKSFRKRRLFPTYTSSNNYVLSDIWSSSTCTLKIFGIKECTQHGHVVCVNPFTKPKFLKSLQPIGERMKLK